MADQSLQHWATSVLDRLGVTPTAANTRALVGWAKAEGGHFNNDARFNPLNTTQPMPGAGNTGTQGNIKVYRAWNQGVDATVRTLRNGRYGGIIAALRRSDPGAVARAVGSSPWGTNAALVAQTISATPAVTPARQSSSQPTASAAAAAPDNRQARAALVQQFLSDRNANPVDLALGIRALNQQAPATSNPSAPAGDTGTTPNGRSPLLEMFWQGPGGINVKNGQKVPQGFVSGHQGHVHVAAGPQTVVALGKLAQRMGLNVGENSRFTGRRETGGHAPNSYHYRDQAIDVSGDPASMRAYAQRVARMYGIRP